MRTHNHIGLNTAAWLLSVWFCTVSVSYADPDPLVTELKVSQLRFSGARGAVDYCQATENQELPGEASLVLILHGGSGRGDDNVRQLTTPAAKPLLEFVRTHVQKAVVIIPQCPPDRDWVRMVDGSSMVSIVSELVKVKMEEFNVSSNRVYITGISMGGGGGYAMLASEPGLFARAVMVSASGRPSDAAKMKGGFNIFHGEDDQVISVESAREMANALRENQDVTVQFTVFPGKGHFDAAEIAYSDACWHWLFQTQQTATHNSGLVVVLL